jgi:hypothetical protein
MRCEKDDQRENAGRLFLSSSSVHLSAFRMQPIGSMFRHRPITHSQLPRQRPLQPAAVDSSFPILATRLDKAE